MKKTFEVIGNSGDVYIVEFSDEDGKIQASCTCPAGEHCILCKHIIQCIEKDAEILETLNSYGLINIYNEYITKMEESEKIKLEAKNIKKKFARMLLGRYRDKKVDK